MKRFVIMGIMLAYFCTCSFSILEFTNCRCTSLNGSFVQIEYCFLKAINRTYKYISLKANLNKEPITNLSVNFALYKKANGYKPFLYNFTFEACSYLKHRNNKLISFFHGAFEQFSNMNHTCPYQQDIIVEKLPISHIDYRFMKILPFPEGEYKFDSIWGAHGAPRARFELYFKK